MIPPQAWTASAVSRQLKTFDAPFKGASCTVPMVMDNADVIGGLYHQPVGAVHGFLYDSRRGLWTAVEPDGAAISAVIGLNDFGTAIVSSQASGAGTQIDTYHAQTGTFAVLPWPLPAFSMANPSGLAASTTAASCSGFRRRTHS